MHPVNLLEAGKSVQVGQILKHKRNEVFVAGQGQPIVEENPSTAVSKRVSYFVSPMTLVTSVGDLEEFRYSLFPNLTPVHDRNFSLNEREFNFGSLRFQDPDNGRRIDTSVDFFPHPDLALIARKVSNPDEKHWHFSEYLGHVRFSVTIEEWEIYKKLVTNLDPHNLAYLDNEDNIFKYAQDLAIPAKKQKIDQLQSEIDILQRDVKSRERYPNY